MHILGFLAFGLIAGALARLLGPSSMPSGWMTSLAFGVLGAFLGSFLGHAAGAQPA